MAVGNFIKVLSVKRLGEMVYGLAKRRGELQFNSLSKIII